jgi:hypothetical protein
MRPIRLTVAILAVVLLTGAQDNCEGEATAPRSSSGKPLTVYGAEGTVIEYP